MAQIGFIGLGHMGLPMAQNLLKSGHEVIGYDKAPEPMSALKASGGRVAKSLSEVCKKQDVVITMLQTPEQVRSVCLEESGGVFQMMSPGTLYIDASTIDVATSRAVHAQAQEKKLFMVDAPVSGGVAGAKAGTLTFMVGGTQNAYDKARDILILMGSQVIYLGEAGSGVVAKICNNMILGITMAGVSEAFILAEKLGLSPNKLHEIVTQSSGQCWVMDQYVPVSGVLDDVPANHDYLPGFSSAMMLKDLKLAQHESSQACVNSPLGNEALELYAKASETIDALDFSAIYQFLKNNSSLI